MAKGKEISNKESKEKKEIKNEELVKDNSKLKSLIDIMQIINRVDNSSVLFKKDALVNTSTSGDIILRYTGKIFNEEFAVTDLNQFIVAFQIFEGFDYKFNKQAIVFKSNSDKKSFNYMLEYGDIKKDLEEDLNPALEHINTFRDKVEDLDNEKFFSFNFTPDVIKELKNISSKFGLKDLCISFKKGDKKDKIQFKLINIDLKNEREYDVELNILNDSDFDHDCEFFIDINNLIEMSWVCYYFDEKEDIYLISEDKKYDMVISHLVDDDLIDNYDTSDDDEDLD
jgi:hypothetical protein